MVRSEFCNKFSKLKVEEDKLAYTKQSNCDINLVL